MPHQSFIGPDGKPWPSATELTNLLPKDWLWAWYKRSVQKNGWAGWESNLATSEEGKLIGTQVHERLEHLVKKLPIVAYETRAGEYAEAIYNRFNPLVEEYVAIEPHLISHKIKTHGTADLVYRRNYVPGLRIGDYKTSYKKDPSHPIQLAVYSLCWNEFHPDQQIDSGDIIRIDKDSKNLNVAIDEYNGLSKFYPLVGALRDIWGYLHDKR